MASQPLPSFDISFDSDEEIFNACITVESLEKTVSENNVTKRSGEIVSNEAKKCRFGEVTEGEMTDLLENAQANATKRTTKWSVSVLQGWCSEKGITIDLGSVSLQELDKHLRQFYAEARNQSGESYSRATLLALRNGLERHLNNPPLNRGVKMSTDPAFVLSNKVLDAQIKKLKREGKENTTHKFAIAQHDIEKLKTSTVLLPCNPHSLLKNVWFHTSLYWCRRGREGQRSLTTDSFSFEEDDQGQEYVTMTHDELTKNHPGGLSDVQSYEKMGRMYKTDSKTDGFTSLKFYLSKVNPKCKAFFQYPKNSWKQDDEIWYENRPVGVNKLSKMMSQISQEAQLSKIYTNHCVRATAITVWSTAGLPDRQIMAISGHRSESSLKSYHSRPSSGQLKQCSDVLSLALGQGMLEPVNSNISRSSSQTCQREDEDDRRSFDKMFTNCTIQNLQVNFNRR